MKRTIAIIGATGNMGAALAKKLSGGSDRLLLFARDKDKLTALAEKIRQQHPASDLDTMACQVEASWEADIIIPAIPYHLEKEVAEQIRQVATRKIVVSISNPLNKNFDGLVTAPDSSAAEELQKLLSHSKIVKAFSTAFAADFEQPTIHGQQIDSFLAGDDEESVQIVSELVTRAGFNPVIAGALSQSRILENMTALLIQINLKYQYRTLAGWKILHN
ncbi:MAG: NADPH-dependent F420 reductase [Flavisolibacter sp.]